MAWKLQHLGVNQIECVLLRHALFLTVSLQTATSARCSCYCRATALHTVLPTAAAAVHDNDDYHCCCYRRYDDDFGGAEDDCDAAAMLLLLPLLKLKLRSMAVRAGYLVWGLGV